MMVLLPSLATVAPKLQRENTKYMKERIRDRKDPKHEDYMSALIQSGEDVPDVDFLVAQSMNLVIGNAEAVSNMFLSTIYLLLKHPDKLEHLKKEIRARFYLYEEITYESIQNLPWLNAVINEALRYATNGTSGLPRTSPGAVVDGHYIPRGVRVFFTCSSLIIIKLLNSFSSDSTVCKQAFSLRFILKGISKMPDPLVQSDGSPRTIPATIPYLIKISFQRVNPSAWAYAVVLVRKQGWYKGS